MKSEENLLRHAARNSRRTRGARPVMKDEPQPPFPLQKQTRPGRESAIAPAPRWQASRYRAAGKLEGQVALITGGDSGIGRAVAVLFAREGADVAINFLAAEKGDALATQRTVEALGRQCLLLPGDLAQATVCTRIVAQTVKQLGKLDILVHNAAHQSHVDSLAKMTEHEFDVTYKVNMYAYFRLVKAALPHLQAGASIIATSSVTGLLGSEGLPAYSSTKGAINTFTKTLAMELIPKGIRVNAVAPGPVWTPLNIADPGRSAKEVSEFGRHSPMGRPAQPEELAPAYVFLASDADSSYITGTVLEVMGGETSGG